LKPAIAEKAKEKQQEAGHDKLCQNSDEAINTKKAVAKAAGLSHDTIHKVEVIVEGATEEAKERLRSGETSINHEYNMIADRRKIDLVHVSYNSGNNEWYTPPVFIEASRTVMGGIDLDPASSIRANSIVHADEFYTQESDGLIQEWHGRVWMNPPYAQDLVKRFTEKLLEELQNIEQAIVLVNNATETGWCQSLLCSCVAVCFLRGRIKYLDASGDQRNTPLQGQAVMYFGDRQEVFANVFSELGQVLIHG